jgi:diguanylate cyclase
MNTTSPQSGKKQAAGSGDIRQLRSRRLRLGMLSWIMAFAMALYAWALGLLDMSLAQFGLVGALVMVVQLGLHMAIRSGGSERFRDPSLTLFQILFATFVALYIIGHADEARAILLMLFIIAAFFGVFQLRKEEYVLVALVAVFGFAMIIIGEIFDTSDRDRRTLLLLELGVFAVVMFWIAFIGSYVANLRRKLSQHNRNLEQAAGHLQHMAQHDELTGLPNRRHLIARLELAHATAEAGDHTFSVAVLDLDHFKQVNDHYGHQAGDEVLAQFAERVTEILRGGDQVVRVDDSLPDIGRFGGEEFLAILPGTDLAGAHLAAERLRREISDQPFETDAGPIQCTVSIGLAEYQAGEPVHHTVGRADEALYRAKEEGRNRVAAA